MISGCEHIFHRRNVLHIKERVYTHSFNPHCRTSLPYWINGYRVDPRPVYESYNQHGISGEIGEASFYGSDFHGKLTATGDRFNKYEYTGAHRTLPIPCIARVTNLSNGRTLIVKINDRGPFALNKNIQARQHTPFYRILDLSEACAEFLGYKRAGYTQVHFEVLIPETASLFGIEIQKKQKIKKKKTMIHKALSAAYKVFTKPASILLKPFHFKSTVHHQ